MAQPSAVSISKVTRVQKIAATMKLVFMNAVSIPEIKYQSDWLESVAAIVCLDVEIIVRARQSDRSKKIFLHRQSAGKAYLWGFGKGVDFGSIKKDLQKSPAGLGFY